jgi:ribosomal-protein-alanine N-acetyltransferase
MTAAGAIPPLRIRSCGLQHANTLARLHATLFEPAWDADTFKELMAFPGALAFAAGPGVVDGLAGGRRTEPWGLILGRVVVDEAEILTLGVAEGRRRLGIAGRLIQKLCQVAGKRGAQRLHLEVAESNGAARALYARLGFRELGRRRGYYERAGAPPEDALNLYLTLGHCAPGGASGGAPGGGKYGRRRSCHL